MSFARKHTIRQEAIINHMSQENKCLKTSVNFRWLSIEKQLQNKITDS